MPFSAGPNIAARPNLVFEYDTGDVQNSYKGEPTTNLVDPSWASWGVDSSGAASSGTRTIISPYYCQIVDSTSNTRQSIYITGISASTTYTFSVQYRSIGGAPTLRFQIQAYNGGSYISTMSFATTAQLGIVNSSDWQTAFITLTTPANTNRILWFMQDGDDYTTYTHAFELKNVQLEQKSHVTPFTPSTRSNTQGLLDVSGYNTTIDLSNMAYTSTAGLSFNGSTTEMHPTTVLSYLSSSAMECVFSTATVSGLKTIFGYSQNGGYSQPTIGSMYLDSNTLNASVITAAQVYRTATAAATISANTFYHVVLNKDTSGGNLQLYVNGTLSGTQTFDVATYGQWSSPGNYIGSNLLDIGKSTNTNVGQGWSTSALSGSIPIARIYNITLLATQVLQNYNQLKSRFNLQ